MHSSSGDTSLSQMLISWVADITKCDKHKISYVVSCLLLASGLLTFLPGSVAVAQTHEDALLRASNAESTDDFSRSVSIDEDRAIVGAWNEDGPSNNKSTAGAAYVFERDGSGTWQQVRILRPSNAERVDNFGGSVAISGDRAIVGARFEDGSSNNLNRAGAAYVFERTSSGWPKNENQILRASNAESGDWFGTSVSISGDRAVVGAHNEDGPSNNLRNAGAAYIFERTSSGWPKNENQILRASNAERKDVFGTSVSISGDHVIVGAYAKDGPSDSNVGAGAAYVFERTSSGWPHHEDQILRASNSGNGHHFGYSVSINGNRAVVGARWEDGPSNNLYRTGAAYVFERTSSGWPKNENQILRASNAESGDWFGTSVSISGDRAVVGAHNEDGPSNNLKNAGAAYIFERTTSGWSQTENEILRASNAEDADSFGFSVSISGDRAIIGARLEDGPSNNKRDAGAVYLNDNLKAPTAMNDQLQTVGEVSTAVLANDGPGLGTFDLSSVQVETRPTDGTASGNANGTITYTPNGGFTGEDSFTYSVANQNGNRSPEATVTVNVLPDAYGAGSAVVLDGNGDYVGLPDDPAINTGGPYDTRTIELWFKATGVSGSAEQVLYEEGGGGNGFNVYLKSGTLYAGAWSESNTTWNGTWHSTSSVQSDTWHHVALVFDEPGGILRAYLDGQRFGDATPGSQMASHGGDIAIGATRGGTKFDVTGAHGSTGKYFEGQIDQLRLWNGALTKSHIRARAKRKINLSAPIANDLIATYRFDSESVTAAFDYSTTDGTAQDGSFSGNPQPDAFSGAQFGDVSAALTSGSATVGASGGTVSVSNVSTSGSDALQVYRYGENDGPTVDATRPEEDFSGVGPDRHLHVVWGLDAVGSSPSADVTFDYSGVNGVNDPGAVRLLKREGPGQPWTDVTSSWNPDPQQQTFSKSGVSSFSQYAIGGTAQSLPVELVSFEAQRSEQSVRLTWQTATETGNARFEVQRKQASNWTTIGRREGTGTTSERQTYRFADRDLPYDADSLAYRLRQVDTDGTVHLSDPVTVQRGGVGEVTLEETHPNPARQQVTVRFAVPEGTEGDARLTLYDVLGRRVRTVIDASVEGRVQQQMEVSGLSSGTYVLRLEAGGTVLSRKLTVLR